MAKRQKKYTLTLTQKQVEIVEQALEVYFRCGMGQFRNALDRYFWSPKISVEDSHYAYTYLDLIGSLLTGMPSNASPGSASPKVDDRYRVAYDIYQTVRHRLAHDELKPGEKPGIEVRYDAPRHLSTEEPLPQIKSS